MKLVVLGSGTSTGVPRIGNDWGQCDPEEPRNRRTRVAIVVEGDDGIRLLVDTPTDLRHQLLSTGIDRIDGVVWTHDHADHTHGIDDLRPLRMGRGAPIPGFAADETVRRLRQRFGYVFAGQHGYHTICELDNLDRMRMIAGIASASTSGVARPGFSTIAKKVPSRSTIAATPEPWWRSRCATVTFKRLPRKAG